MNCGRAPTRLAIFTDFFFFSSRRRHTRLVSDWSSDVCSSDLNHPMGLNANVATTAANKGVLLAIVAMAQTLVVLTSGIDLSVGMVMVLANCLASSIVVGTPLMTGLSVVGVLLMGAACGAINGLIVIYGRLQP